MAYRSVRHAIESMRQGRDVVGGMYRAARGKHNPAGPRRVKINTGAPKPVRGVIRINTKGKTPTKLVRKGPVKKTGKPPVIRKNQVVPLPGFKGNKIQQAGRFAKFKAAKFGQRIGHIARRLGKHF